MYKGTALHAPKSQAIRPTSDRLRETIFNLLEHRFDDPVSGASIMDVFAGTGALGLEAMSRGAKFCLFVDEAAAARGLIRRNIETLGLMGKTRLFRRDATHMGKAKRTEGNHLIFLDPPYSKGLGDKALGSLIKGKWLMPGGLVIFEEDAQATINLPLGTKIEEQRFYGETQLLFIRYE